jgi:hypothetical protein
MQPLLAAAAVPVKELNDVPAGENNGEVVVVQEGNGMMGNGA